MRCHLKWLVLLVAALAAGAATIQEDFGRDPAAGGWKRHGDASLFGWNEPRQRLDVAWDSSRTNSYFYLPLGTVLARADDFGVEFDLWLADIAVGVNTNQPFTFELALGFVNVASATNPDLQRGAGVNAAHGPRNLVEFDYFPDSGFGATVWPALVSSNNQVNFRGLNDYLLAELAPANWYHISMQYTASNGALATVVLRNGAPFASHLTQLMASFSDFRLDGFAICSYSDWGSDGSLLAHGAVDNVRLTLPAAPVSDLAGGLADSGWQAQFLSRSNWMYSLERTPDFRGWWEVAGPEAGTGAPMTLIDRNAPTDRAFYRVKAQRP